MVNHLKRVAVAAAVLFIPAGVALAQGGPPWAAGGWPHFPFLPFLLLLAVIAGLAFILVRRSPKGETRENTSAQKNAGLDILKERFARGEIEATEFEERRRVIQNV
jgi:putative membrane protein